MNTLARLERTVRFIMARKLRANRSSGTRSFCPVLRTFAQVALQTAATTENSQYLGVGEVRKKGRLGITN